VSSARFNYAIGSQKSFSDRKIGKDALMGSRYIIRLWLDGIVFAVAAKVGLFMARVLRSCSPQRR
jgi:hypothetical protein